MEGSYEGEMDADQASQTLKKLAADQKVSIELTQDQLEAILGQWDEGDPRKPAEITFYVERKPQLNVTVAGYRYRGDTCCV